MGGWMPGATLMRGHNAGYRAGRVIRSTTVAHYTVGVNSAGIGAQGYFNFLIRRNGEIVQFAESDAVTWHAGNWNSRGPGIEVEYYPPTASSRNDGPPPENIFTEVQLEACGRVVRWLHETDGYPLDFYDGPRISSHNGTITHRSLIQTGDAHHDYWSHDQWNRMIEGGFMANVTREELIDWFQDRDKFIASQLNDEKSEFRAEIRRENRALVKKYMAPIYDHLGVPMPQDNA